MSVLIKGMTMPESCERCPMLDWDLDYIKCKATGRHFKMTECWRSSRISDCPLVPVPPHGDLIDRDALPIHGLSRRGGEWLMYAEADEIMNAPVIIEEEEQ